MVNLPHIGILVTNGGAHPVDKWAEASANEIANIVTIDEQSTSDAARTARKAKPRFALDLLDALEVFHKRIQDHEKEQLNLKGLERLEEEHECDEACEEAVEIVIKVAEKTPFAEEFKRPEIKARVHAILHADMNTIVHIERSLLVDQNIHEEKAKKWFAMKHG